MRSDERTVRSTSASGAERRTKSAHTGTAGKHYQYTFEDFCFLVKDGQKADLIDGVIYMASPDNIDAYRHYRWLGHLMSDYSEETDQGEIFGSRVAFRLGDLGSPEPDLAFVQKERLHLVRRGFFDGPPDAAFELVSPESIDRDYVLKRSQYEAAGVTEYWIIDAMERKVTLLRLAANGKYREVKPRKGELHSAVLRGFWLRPEWLWQEPLPRKRAVLQQLLDRLEPPAKP
jgi:Uma2 family endonuclease